MKKYRTWFIGYCIILTLTFLTAHLGNHAIFTIAENMPIHRFHTIIIDPGHGGVDGGATSCTGVPESQFNLEISLRLNDLLQFLGYHTKMIRTEDISVYTEGKTIANKKISDLKERVRIVNECENGILLSIHQNTFPDKQYYGPQVFYAETEGSHILAKQLQEAFLHFLTPSSRRQEKHSKNIYLMEHIQCPGVLIECGFLSNPEEEQNLKTAMYQKKLCAVIACTVSENLANT